MINGEYIKRIRKERGLKGFQLAQKLGVTPGAITHWERGRRVPRYEILPSLAEALGVEIIDLGDFSDKSKSKSTT